MLDRINRIDAQTAALCEAVGTATVADNLTEALTALFSSVAVAIVALITFRVELRVRLRRARPAGGVPLATEAAIMIATYLTAERDLGRIAGDADIDTLAPTLIGAAHLLFADRTSSPPTPDAVHGMVTTVIAHVASEKGNRRRPPDVGPSMADMPPGRITLRLRRLWQEQRWIRAPLLLIPLALGFGFWWLTRPQLPTQQEAQQEVATQVGQREHTTVTATCTEPQDSGYSCTLRDAAGRYGYAITTFTKNKSNNRYGHKWDSTTIWEFPLNADGTGTKTLDTSPPRDLSLALTAAASAIGNSIGRNFPDMYGAIKCGDRVTSEVTMCAVRAPLLSATIQALGDNKYQLTYRVALP